MKNDYQAKLCQETNYQSEYLEGSETEEKQYGHHDKYLFPYTAEEDHAHTTTTATYLPPSRVISPGLVTNDVNNPGDFGIRSTQGSRMGSHMGSTMGSLCGGSIRGSPSPMVQGPLPPGSENE